VGVRGHRERPHETTLMQFRRDVEHARYSAQRAERRYRAVDPESKLVARGLEAEWNSALQEFRALRTNSPSESTLDRVPHSPGARLDPRTRQRL